jgi:L-amino acid N-acyltransferase YncA
MLNRAQGRGLGTALLRKLAGSLGAKGFKGMTVWVLERNRQFISMKNRAPRS